MILDYFLAGSWITLATSTYWNKLIEIFFLKFAANLRNMRLWEFENKRKYGCVKCWKMLFENMLKNAETKGNMRLCVFKNWKMLFENIYGNTCGWKSVLRCVKCCLKTENCCLKIQTKHPLRDFKSHRLKQKEIWREKWEFEKSGVVEC